MHCIAIEPGHLLWSSSIALPTDENTEIKSAPVVNDDMGIVVAGTHGGAAAGLSTLDGHLLWRLQLPGAIFAAPLLVPRSDEMSLGQQRETQVMFTSLSYADLEVCLLDAGPGGLQILLQLADPRGLSEFCCCHTSMMENVLQFLRTSQARPKNFGLCGWPHQSSRLSSWMRWHPCWW